MEKLSPVAVRNANKPGMYGDGGGLWLHVGPNAIGPDGKPTKTGKSWVFRYMIDGRAREMGLGPLHTISLAQARDLARSARQQVLQGDDPLEAKHTDRQARRREAAKAITFRACAERYIAANRPAWANEKHASQWENTLSTYVFPVIGALSVGEIDTGHITKILQPIWTVKSETASRVRGRIEVVLNYAAVHGWRTGENPARWRGHLENVLPKKSKVAKVEHHAALPWQEIGPFMTRLNMEKGASALALRFAILTAARTGEVIGAKWEEIDRVNKIWTVPGERMKAGREHRVPLTEAALAVLDVAEGLRLDEADYVFPGAKKDAPLSNMAMLTLLRRMKRDDLTAHGFRSTFRDWAAETGQPADIAEAALAHVVGNKTVAAYQRGDLLNRRRKLMQDWATFCAGKKE
ncbi:site-specific integrase [Acidocella sp.]|uniref:tyrosine-type recombinase/integrase n=1 Tax=Acidocella sp. TaxID=50710 RepID=UPI002639D82B|nr:site-specific integrase [Acidocella sp.]